MRNQLLLDDPTWFPTDPEYHAYSDGYADGLQEALDLVNRAVDFIADHPSHPLDLPDILARIITDIQAVPLP